MDREEKREQLWRDALAAWSDYQTTGLHLTSEEADAWLAALAASRPLLDRDPSTKIPEIPATSRRQMGRVRIR